MDFAYITSVGNTQWDIGAPRDTEIKPDGTSLFVYESSDGFMYEFAMSTPFDLGTINTTPVASLDVKTMTGSTSDDWYFTFKPDGTTFIVGGGVNAYSINLATAWDLSTASLGGTSPDLSGFGIFGNNGGGVSPDGVFLYALDYNSTKNKAYQSSMSTPWDVTTMTVGTATLTSADFDFWTTEAYDICFIDNGVTALIACNATKNIYTFLCSTPGDLATAKATSNIWTPYQDRLNWGGPLLGMQEVMDSSTRYLFAWDGGNSQQTRYDYSPTFVSFTGVVQEDGSPASRLVAAYTRRDLRHVQTVRSASLDGSFTFDCLISGEEHFIIAFDDTSDATDYNAVIYDRVVGV